MKATLILTILALLLGQAATAEPYWAQISLAVPAPNTPEVLAAADKFMSSEVGKTFPGRMLLQMNTAAGNDAPSHTFVPIYKSAADREKFVASLQGNAAWAELQAALTRLGQPGGTILYRNVGSWGDINDKDDVWVEHAFAVSDPGKFVAAMNAFMASATGKKAPGGVYLSAVVAGGISPVSHVVSVSYDSVEEMASWLVVRDASADWATFLAAARPAGTYLGASMAGDLKAWGPIGMKKIVAP